MSNNYQVAGIGELLWDCLPSGMQLGGAPCNFAYHAMQRGCACVVISAIGKDDLGNKISETLRVKGLSTDFIQEKDVPTSTVTVTLDENGQPNYTIHEHVAWDQISWNANLEVLAKRVDAVCFGSLAQRNEVSCKTIQQFLEATNKNCLRVFDINLRQRYYNQETIEKSLELATVLKLNDEELPIVASMFHLIGTDEELLQQLIRRFDLQLIALTKGCKGSLVMNHKNEKSYMEVPPVIIVDTVGAGDSFTAVLVAGLLQKHDMKTIHENATRVAAFVCTQNGAMPDYKYLQY